MATTLIKDRGSKLKKNLKPLIKINNYYLKPVGFRLKIPEQKISFSITGKNNSGQLIL